MHCYEYVVFSNVIEIYYCRALYVTGFVKTGPNRSRAEITTFYCLTFKLHSSITQMHLTHG